MINFIKRFDKFAEPISVNYRGAEKFETIGGGCLSVFISIVILVYAIGSAGHLVSRKHPPILTTTIEYASYQTDNTKFNLEEQDLDIVVNF